MANLTILSMLLGTSLMSLFVCFTISLIYYFLSLFYLTTTKLDFQIVDFFLIFQDSLREQVVFTLSHVHFHTFTLSHFQDSLCKQVVCGHHHRAHSPQPLLHILVQKLLRARLLGRASLNIFWIGTMLLNNKNLLCVCHTSALV